MAQRVIFHIDVNSAFLSWTAAYRVQVLGDAFDLREVPSVIAGDKASRHSIILAKSTPAKKFGIKTGEPLFQAQQKCPDLVVAEPDYALYVEASRRLIRLLKETAPVVEQYSIDEAWVDMTGTNLLYGPPLAAAEMLRKRIFNELGFTVNIGISSNKLLAKMAGDFEKPNKIHTLFPEEIPAKLWPLPVRDLFMVGPATEKKLRRMGIETIGQLAQSDASALRQRLGKQGDMIWHYANGRNSDPVQGVAEDNKSYGNAVTTSFDVTSLSTARQVLLSLCETVCMRMRRDSKSGGCVAVQIRTDRFADSIRQRQLTGRTDVTKEIYQAACAVLEELWDGKTPLRQLGVQVSNLACEPCCQCDIFTDPRQSIKRSKLDGTVDALRLRYGEDVLRRARFIGSDMAHMAGGLAKERRTGVTKTV